MGDAARQTPQTPRPSAEKPDNLFGKAVRDLKKDTKESADVSAGAKPKGGPPVPDQPKPMQPVDSGIILDPGVALQKLGTGSITAIVWPKYAACPDDNGQPDKCPVFVNQEMGVWIDGQGECNKVSLRWGDGTMDEVWTNVTLPIPNTPHTYYSNGVYEIRAWGEGCGSAASGFVVHPPPQSQQAIHVLCPSPKITQVWGRSLSLDDFLEAAGWMPNPNKPVGEIKHNTTYQLRGCSFGSQKGEVFLKNKGLMLYGGNFPALVELTVYEWLDNSIAVSTAGSNIPSTGVRDQMVDLYLTTAGGNPQTSNEFGLQYIAPRMYSALHGAEFDLECGPATSKCLIQSIDTMSAKHRVHPNGNPVAGTDRLHVQLKNGWVLKEITGFGAHAAQNSAPGWKVDDPVGFVPGSANATIAVSYDLPPGAFVWYFLQATIEGPSGLPYK